MVTIAATPATARIVAKLGMEVWRECRWQGRRALWFSRWSDYRDEQDRQVFLLPVEKGDVIVSYIKVFQGGE